MGRYLRFFIFVFRYLSMSAFLSLSLMHNFCRLVSSICVSAVVVAVRVSTVVVAFVVSSTMNGVLVL